jgi:hypothetical protein
VADVIAALDQTLIVPVAGDVHPTTIAKIEAGDRAVRIDEATALADIFEVSLDSLLGRTARVVNDPTYPLRAMQEKAQRWVWDVGVIYRSFRERFIEASGLEFEGRENFESQCRRALDALNEAHLALFELAGFKVPDLVQVRPGVLKPLEGVKSEKES